MLHCYGKATGGDIDACLRAAMLVYWNEAGTAMVMCHDVHYAEDGVPRLLSGHPLTRDLAEILVTGLQGAAPLIATVLPEEVIWASPTRLAWWRPSQRRRIWFSNKTEQGKALQHVTKCEVWHPALFYVADQGHLQVWALANNERPTNGTELYQAPYWNVYADGGVCAGSVVWPKSIGVDAIPEWEKTWHSSEGTFPTAPRLTNYPGGHNALWDAMRTAEAFPVESLIPTGQTVLDALNHTHKPYTGPIMREQFTPAERNAA